MGDIKKIIGKAIRGVFLALLLIVLVLGVAHFAGLIELKPSQLLKNNTINEIKNSGFCDNSNLTFEDTLSLKYDKDINWKEFTTDGNNYVEVNAISKSGKTFKMQYLIKKTKSGKIVPKRGYIEIDGKKSNLFGLLFLCMG